MVGVRKKVEGVKVVEQFLSWQGEGVSCGRRAMFYRFGGCNLRCEFCDTKYAWGRGEEEAVMPWEDVKLVVVTGGEPLWGENRKMVRRLVEVVRRELGCDVEIETNGTQEVLWEEEVEGLRYVVSPKMARVWEGWYRRGDVVWKFVVGKKELDKLFEMYMEEGKLEKDKVWLMPVGVTVKDLVKVGRRVVELGERYGVNVTTRLHVLYGVK